MFRRLLLLSLGGCWVTSDEVEDARARVVVGPSTPVPQPTPVPTDPPPTDTDTDDPLACVDGQLQAGEPVSDSTQGASDDLDLSCLDGVGPDVAYLFTPVVTGCHRVRVSTSDGAPVAAALFDDCEVDPVTCAAGHPDDGVTAFVSLSVGKDVVVAVERVDAGPYTVEVGPAFDEDMGSTDQLDTSNVGTTTNPYPRMCIQPLDFVGEAIGGTYVRWVAPFGGRFEVRASSDEIDPILSLHRACQPAPAEQCSDTAGPGVAEFLEFDAEEDEEVMFRVASYLAPRGAFTLRIEPVVSR